MKEIYYEYKIRDINKRTQSYKKFGKNSFPALNNYIITGLNLTLKEVKSKTNSLFRQISDFCTVEGNYKKIREEYEEILKLLEEKSLKND